MTNESPQNPGVSRRTVLKASTVAVGGLGTTGTAAANGSGDTEQTADVVGQGPDGDVVVEDGATIRRSNHGVETTVQMPTPKPGSYEYPDPEENDTVSEPGHPEGFTLWVFVFDDPEDDEFTGVFLGAGHVVGGDTLTLSGHVSTSTEPFVGDPVKNPRGAEIHLAVAPHGEVDDEIMPDQIKRPGGGPEHWWFALFDPETKS